MLLLSNAANQGEDNIPKYANDVYMNIHNPNPNPN